jgi:putative hydroxymethylpyrimidine transport system substrate-binding protein
MFKKISLLTLCLCFSQAQAQTKHQLDLILDWYVNPNHGPLIVAQQQGFFANENLNVVLHEPSDPAMPAKLVALNKYDMAVTYQNDFVNDLLKGLPLMRSGALISTPLNCIMVLKKSGITSLSQLDGKKLGYSIASEGPFLDALLKHGQTKPVKPQKVKVGWNLSQALLSGQVDAVSGGYRNVERHQINLKGFDVTMFFPEDHGVPNHDELILVINAKQHNPDDVRAFNRALARAVQFIRNHPKQAWQSFIAHNPKALNNKLNKLSWDSTVMFFDARPGAVNQSRYETYAQYLKAQNIIAKVPDFSKALFR